ncbi:Na+/H+ antiporter NhaA [Streptomyces canus]|uniref:Na+/H+ antiporter NhaA n=1 Tax=Streptomyces canus TaxID=58343 RepID=UPI002257A94D|nr:Na+/H+ antiporter NhaA [Streptomyces canus]MCX4862216.1 Na+/H+ antiporter NhaA [Streptomyces canus]WSW32690.1 Na+/H+ antiporter NhaA [Streptomyces canus]
MSPGNGQSHTFLGRLPLPERKAVADALRTETVGGMLLLVAAAAALVWANTPLKASYGAVRDAHFGIPAWELDLSVAHWTSDGLLTLFFFVAGAELKRELVSGDLRSPATAALPVVAAVCGMAVPALVYGVTATSGGGSWNGWAVPMATDIAFALGILAVINTHLPSALRAFLLTLAVVDDVGAILVIAAFFTSSLNVAALAGAGLGLGLFYWLHQRKRIHGWYWYLPLAVTVWALAYIGGVHATVAGVAMGLMLRAGHSPLPEKGTLEHIVHVARPLSAGLAAPLFALFALFAAGVSVSAESLRSVLDGPEPLGVAVGLTAGKTLGIFCGTYLAVRFTRARLNPALAWADVFALSVLAGIGFTVSLLLGELAFPDPAQTQSVKAAVLLGSLTSALLATLLLRLRNARYRALYEQETLDLPPNEAPQNA